MSKIIVLTGASGPMGNVVAATLEDEGYYVIGLTSKEVKSIQGVAKVIVCDFRDRLAILRAIENIRIENSEIYGIVNLAGIFLEMDNFKEEALKNFEDTFDINFWPALMLTSGLADNLSQGGSIVNVSSTDAFFGGISGAGYSASKAALNSLSMSLANILAGKRIRSNAIAGGWIGSGMGTPKEVLDTVAEDNPLGRVGEYSDVASLVSFLLSDKSSYINGSVITLDGGDSATNASLVQESRALKKA